MGNPADQNELNGRRAEAIAAISVALDVLQAEDLSFDGLGELTGLTRSAEGLRRRLDALIVDAAGEVNRRALHLQDGYRRTTPWLQTITQSSGAAAAARVAVAEILPSMPAAAAAFRAGLIGGEQIRLLGRLGRNPRCADQLPDSDDLLTEDAKRFDADDFRRICRRWETLADPDGADQGAQARHANRKARLAARFDQGWDLSGRFGDLQGATLAEIWDRFYDAELALDWERARAEHGEGASQADLWRTPANRRADALEAIFQAAIRPPEPDTGPAEDDQDDDDGDGETSDIDESGIAGEADSDGVSETADGDVGAEPGEESSDRGAEADDDARTSPPTGTAQDNPDGHGHDGDCAEPAVTAGDPGGVGAPGGSPGRPPGPAPGTKPHRKRKRARAPEPLVNLVIDAQTAQEWVARAVGVDVQPDPRTYRDRRFGTLDGTPVAPSEIVAALFWGPIRRVVMDQASIVIDLGRKSRGFVRGARVALELQDQRCAWKGCDRKPGACQGDHLTAHRDGGETNPADGALLCGFHNRLKEAGYRIWRDPDGQWHTYRPDGTEIA